MLPTSENSVNAKFTGMAYLPHRPGPPVALQLVLALERKEGDVVLLLPALPYEGVEFLQEKVS